MKLRHIIITLVILVIFLFSRWGIFYTIDETEQVIVTQLGKVVGEPITEPGLNVKIPFIQAANYFPKNVLEWDGKPDEIPTKDKVNISVDTFARWKIVDPLRFYKTLINERQAQGRLDDILDSK
ncbi:SPFH domain-containing protein, partial [Thermodesulfobacteriota bacterium]